MECPYAIGDRIHYQIPPLRAVYWGYVSDMKPGEVTGKLLVLVVDHFGQINDEAAGRWVPAADCSPALREDQV